MIKQLIYRLTRWLFADFYANQINADFWRTAYEAKQSRKKNEQKRKPNKN